MTIDIYEYWEKNQQTLNSLFDMLNKMTKAYDRSVKRNYNHIPFAWKVSEDNDILIQKAPDIWEPIR